MAAELKTTANESGSPPTGWIKNVLGFRQFSMRGLHRVQADGKLVCVTLNQRRMAALSAG